MVVSSLQVPIIQKFVASKFLLLINKLNVFLIIGNYSFAIRFIHIERKTRLFSGRFHVYSLEVDSGSAHKSGSQGT